MLASGALESQSTHGSFDSLPSSSTPTYPCTSAQTGVLEPASTLVLLAQKRPAASSVPPALLLAAFALKPAPAPARPGGHQDEGGPLRDAQRRLAEQRRSDPPRGRAFLTLQSVPPVHEAAAGLWFRKCV